MFAEHFNLVILAAGIIGLSYRFAMGMNPSSRFFKLMERGFAAISLIYLWNLATPATVHLGINPLTLVFAAISGTPGVAAMAAVKLIH